MTEHIKGCVVVFDEDTPEADAEAILNAIRMIKGVALVTGEKVEHRDFMNRQRVRIDVRKKLDAALEEVWPSTFEAKPW